jgi:hypothetical protein
VPGGTKEVVQVQDVIRDFDGIFLLDQSEKKNTVGTEEFQR